MSGETRVPPFVQLNGSWYLVVNFVPGLTPPCYLLLRPLGTQELIRVLEATEEFETELWAGLISKDDLRTRSPDTPEDR